MDKAKRLTAIGTVGSGVDGDTAGRDLAPARALSEPCESLASAGQTIVPRLTGRDRCQGTVETAEIATGLLGA